MTIFSLRFRTGRCRACAGASSGYHRGVRRSPHRNSGLRKLHEGRRRTPGRGAVRLRGRHGEIWFWELTDPRVCVPMVVVKVDVFPTAATDGWPREGCGFLSCSVADRLPDPITPPPRAITPPLTFWFFAWNLELLTGLMPLSSGVDDGVQLG